MSTAEGFAVTAAGRRLFAKLAATARPLIFSKVVFGTGSMPEGSQDNDLFQMTDLIEPFANGTSTTPIYENDTVSMTVQFRSDMNGGIEKTVWLSEFGIFAEDPDGGEVLVCYSNFSSCPESILAYNLGGNAIRDFPVSFVIGAASDVKLEFPAGAFLTSEDASELMEACLRRAVGMNAVSFTIPGDAWAEATFGCFNFCAETEVDSVSGTQHPVATLDAASIETAWQCGLSSVVETLDGRLRFRSDRKPAEAISGTCILFTEGLSTGAGTGGALPIATKTRLGGVKIGDGLSVTPDGEISVNPDQVLTDKDLVDENEVVQAVADILNVDDAK